MIGRPRERTPKLSEIQAAWELLGRDALRQIFPNLRCFGIGWGEPFCFRCGWLAPGKEAADYQQDRPYERAIAETWDSKAGWLERAHLHDHAEGGSMDPLNLVPLCVLCHELQPACATREAGIDFVNSEPVHEDLVWIQQLVSDELYREVRRPGRSKALRGMLRAQAIAGAVLAKKLAETREARDRREASRSSSH